MKCQNISPLFFAMLAPYFIAMVVFFPLALVLDLDSEDTIVQLVLSGVSSVVGIALTVWTVLLVSATFERLMQLGNRTPTDNNLSPW